MIMIKDYDDHDNQKYNHDYKGMIMTNNRRWKMEEFICQTIFYHRGLDSVHTDRGTI